MTETTATVDKSVENARRREVFDARNRWPKVTQSQICGDLDDHGLQVSESALSKWETGKAPLPNGVTPADLLTSIRRIRARKGAAA